MSKLDMSPMAKAFMIGMILGSAFGVFYAVFETVGRDLPVG